MDEPAKQMSDAKALRKLRVEYGEAQRAYRERIDAVMGDFETAVNLLREILGGGDGIATRERAKRFIATKAK